VLVVDRRLVVVRGAGKLSESVLNALTDSQTFLYDAERSELLGGFIRESLNESSGMNRTKSTVAALLAGMLVLSVLAPVGAAATTDDSTDLTIDVADEEDPVVTVTHNDSAVENATVDVTIDANETDENASYDGVGTYTTDANGTVDLPAPSEAVTLVITASADNASASTTVELEPSDGEEDGPDETPFGQLLSSFIEDTDKSEVDGPFGQVVADFVHENNPGNAPDHAGPPADAGGDNESNQGPPEHAGNDDADDEEDDEKRGPPAHAGGPNDADDDTEEDDAEEDDVDEEDDTAESDE